MAVIITDMDMPENCMECPLRIQAFCKVDGHHEPYRRKERCPLKPVDNMIEEIKAIEEGISSYSNDRPWIFKDEVIAIIEKYLEGTDREVQE